MDTGTETATQAQDQARLNAELWAQGDFVEGYATRDLRPVEATLLQRHRDALAGRVLELGCGAGRLTGYLCEIARTVHGLDISPAMVAYCRRTYPQGEFSEGDLRDLAHFESGSFDVVVAAFNVLDVLGDAERRGVLDEIHRILAAGGLLIMSSHNRDYAPRLGTTIRAYLGNPRRPVASIKSLLRGLRNRRRLRSLQRIEDGYAILNDQAHEFSVLHYNISMQAQARQFAEQGFEFLECLDLPGATIGPGETNTSSSELHYVARRV
jgi:SAM-dependent methyltransferase